MLLCDIQRRDAAQGEDTLAACLKHTRTLTFRRKCENALKHIEDVLTVCKRPVVSCGGGKDSTATAILARMVEPKIPIVCADPPNPLTDREEHVRNLAAWLGGHFFRVPYEWNVQAVLDGKERYPEGLKMRKLLEFYKANAIDGIIWGLRTSESKSRRLVTIGRGEVYQVKDGSWRCAPCAHMTAAEVLAVSLMHEAPVNSVYGRQRGEMSFEQIHDGTWWPHGLYDMSHWIKTYYPEHYEEHMAAGRVYDAAKSRVCVF